MDALEHLMFAELSLEHDQSIAAWAAIEHIRRARQQWPGAVVESEPKPHPVPNIVRREAIAHGQ